MAPAPDTSFLAALWNAVDPDWSDRSGESSRLSYDPVGDGDVVRPLGHQSCYEPRYRDLPERYRRIEAGIASLHRLLEVTPVGVFDFDTHAFRWSPAAARALGCSPEPGEGTLDAVVDRIVPEDRALARLRLDACLRRGAGEFHCRVLRAHGTVGTISVRARVIPEVAGGPAHLIGTVLDVTRLSDAEEALDLERQRRKLFVSTLAHELRQPLATFRSSLDALGLESAPIAPLRQRMVRQLELMTRLVEDLTDASRWAHGRLSLRRRRVDMRELLDVAVHDIAAALDERGHRLIVDFPGAGPVWAEADPQRLLQVLGNLLRNAAAATDPGGLISLGAEPGADSLTLRVRDNGRGMTPGTLLRIFDWFSQAQPAAAPGLGIGLSITREIVELHGGRIAAASGGPGAGSEFTVTLPLAPSAHPAVERAGHRLANRPLGAASRAVPAGRSVR